MKKNLQTTFSNRQYMLSRDFEIFYYSDSALSRVESHTHDYYEFYFFLEGDISMEIDGELYPSRYGDVVLIPPGRRHRAVIHSQEKPYRRFVFWISREYLSQLLELYSAYGYLIRHVESTDQFSFHNDVVTFNAIQSKVIRLLEEVHGEQFGKEAQVSLCVNDLILYLNRVAYAQDHPVSRSEEQSLYQNLLLYLEEHLEEDLSLERLAKEFFVSKYYIAHLFKDNMGLSIHQFIRKKRLAACRDAIAGPGKISRVYLRYGFKDYSSFYRAFRKEYGMSPGEFQDTVRSDYKE